MNTRNCVLLPAEGKQNTTFSPNFKQPGKVIFMQLSMLQLDSSYKASTAISSNHKSVKHLQYLLLFHTPLASLIDTDEMDREGREEGREGDV